MPHGVLDCTEPTRPGEKPEGASTYTVTLDRAYTLNQVGLSLHYGKPATAMVEVSSDGQSWTEVADTGGITSYALRYFPVQKVRANRVRVTVADGDPHGMAFLNELHRRRLRRRRLPPCRASRRRLDRQGRRTHPHYRPCRYPRRWSSGSAPSATPAASASPPWATPPTAPTAASAPTATRPRHGQSSARQAPHPRKHGRTSRASHP